MTQNEVAALAESEPNQIFPRKPETSISSLPPEIVLVIAKSLAPEDQLHLGLTCKSLFFLTAPHLLGDSIMRQPRQISTRSGIIYDAYHAGFVNLELYEYLLERVHPRSFEFDILCKIAGRRGDIVKIEAWSRRYEMCAFVGAAEGAAGAGNMAVLEWALERTPSPADWEVTRILCAAAKYRREDVLAFLFTRLDQTPQQLLGTIRIAVTARLIDLALRLYRKLPLCCGERLFITAADAIADCSIGTEDWQPYLAQLIETPSFISDAIGWNVFDLAASRNRVDVMRYVDGFCDISNYRNYDSALGYAIAYGNTEAFDYICQTRPLWSSAVDDAIDRMPSSSEQSDACISLVRRIMPHIEKRSSLITLICKAISASNELLDSVADEFRRRFESPSQHELEQLFNQAYAWEKTRALARHFPPQSTEHANEIVRRSDYPVETMELLRQFCPDIDSDIEHRSDY